MTVLSKSFGDVAQQLVTLYTPLDLPSQQFAFNVYPAWKEVGILLHGLVDLLHCKLLRTGREKVLKFEGHLLSLSEVFADRRDQGLEVRTEDYHLGVVLEVQSLAVLVAESQPLDLGLISQLACLLI